MQIHTTLPNLTNLSNNFHKHLRFTKIKTSSTFEQNEQGTHQTDDCFGTKDLTVDFCVDVDKVLDSDL